MERYSTFWRRFWAAFLDVLILSPFGWIDEKAQSLDLSAGQSLAWLFVSNFYFSVYIVLLHALRGQTIGKMITGVTVLTFDTESAITFRQALLRESPYILIISVSWLAVAYVTLTGGDRSQIFFFEAYLGFAAVTWFGLELFSMLLNEKRRALHDFIAGTVVVIDA